MPHPKQGYRLADGTKVPGVTTVLSGIGWNKNQLLWWAWSEGQAGRDFRDTSGKAADIGTCAHLMVECDVLGTDADLSSFTTDTVEKARPAFAAWRQWALGANCTIVATEASLVSEQYRYGGTLDAIASIGGQLQVLDFKTSKAVYPDHLIQLAAYQRLWNETHPAEQLAPGAMLLRIGKDGAFASHGFTQAQLDRGWEAFLHARGLYDLKKILEEATA